jgi:hypothetical protein
MAAHLVTQVLPWVPIRPWIVSGPMSLRDGMMPSRALTAKVPTIIRRTIGQYDVPQAVPHGVTRPTLQSGSVPF